DGNLQVDVVFDDYGTMITPFDTMAVLRQKVVETLNYTVTGRKYLAGQSLYTNQIATESRIEVRYLWWSDSAGFNYPVVEMEVTLSGQVKNVQFAVAMNVGLSSNFVADCADSCDARVAVVSESTPLTYLWSDPDSQIAHTVKNLCQGDYIVTVTNSNGAFVRIPFTINNASKIAASFAGYGSSCESCNDGGVVVTLSGGTGPYDVQWDMNAAFQTTAAAVDLEPGTYSVAVFDANGCPAAFSGIVGLFQGFRVNPNPADDILRVLSRIDGLVRFQIFDLQGRLIRWYEYASSETIIGVETLPEGHYIYRIVDEYGVELKTDHFTIIRP
ncbi:MAG: T9SS type A sorting domain-containing protein, partial [Flavobacteriales bacterium]|nr:T9SS type A sorting domain-containing protein [Flavobacteriales bacterium]